MFRSAEQSNFNAIIARHMTEPDGPLLMEGATGLGKTRAYLAAVMNAAASGRRITIALPSHQLIDQLLVSEDLAVTRRKEVRVSTFRPSRWFDDSEAYRRQRQDAADSGVMVCTSASVIIDQRLGGSYNGSTNREYIVFDEADQLPDTAALQSDSEITRQQLSELGVVAESAQQAALDVITGKGAEPEVRAAAMMILEAIEEPAWFQRAGMTDEGGVVLYHKMPGRLLRRIANRSEVAFISATLTVGGRFDDFKRALGIQKQSDLSSVIEPARHGILKFKVASTVVNTPEWLQLTKETIQQAVVDGPVLVATASHALAQTLGELIDGATVRAGDETATEAAARMGEGKVLIAAGAWAGLDTLQKWRSIVVPRIPYERPVIVDGEVESSFLDTRNTAVRRMRQVIGRGLRSPDANCSVYILDSRYRNVEAFIPQRFKTQWGKREVFAEGDRHEVGLSKIERHPSIRKVALAHYGLKCMGCTFVPKVSSQLDVHHLNPLGEGGERLTGMGDVAVLCANCHRVAHSSDPPLSVKALQDLAA
jgi:Rad3-related DNA helicase